MGTRRAAVLGVALIASILAPAASAARTVYVPITFRIGLEQAERPLSSCLVSVSRGANAAVVLRAASRNKACMVYSYQLGYRDDLHRHFVSCIDHICDDDIYQTEWYQGSPPLPPGSAADWPGPFVEDFHATRGATLTYTYNTRPCVFTPGSYACV
jgi:hypothetical protein